MKMYKCPNCGKLYTSMYCDLCEKSIPSSCATFGAEGSSGNHAIGGAEAAGDAFERIRRLEEKNNFLLSEIEKHTHILSVIAIISVICTAASAILALIAVL